MGLRQAVGGTFVGAGNGFAAPVDGMLLSTMLVTIEGVVASILGLAGKLLPRTSSTVLGKTLVGMSTRHSVNDDLFPVRQRFRHTMVVVTRSVDSSSARTNRRTVVYWPWYDWC